MDAEWLSEPDVVGSALRAHYGACYDEMDDEGFAVDDTQVLPYVNDRIGDKWYLALPDYSVTKATVSQFFHWPLKVLDGTLDISPFVILGGAGAWEVKDRPDYSADKFVAFSGERFPHVKSLPAETIGEDQERIVAVRGFLEREWGGALGQLAEPPTFWNFFLMRVGFRSGDREVLFASRCENEWCNDGITGAWVIRRWEPVVDAGPVKPRLVSGEGEDFHRASRIWFHNALEIESIGNVLVLGLGYYEAVSLVLVKVDNQGDWSEWLVSPFWGQ